MDGYLVFPMVVNGCMSSCEGKKKAFTLDVFYAFAMSIIMIYFWQYKTTMRVENTITMHNRLWFKINGPFTPYIKPQVHDLRSRSAHLEHPNMHT